MANPSIALKRLYQQRLSHQIAASPAEIVTWLGAVQAQEYLGAKWALGLRIPDATDKLVEQAFNDGTILRTHVMRPTWHFVSAADIRWLQELTSPWVNAVNAYMYRQCELDDKLFLQTNAILTKALEGSRQLTRPELGTILEQAGIAAEGVRLGYILHRAELDALICSGPRRGNQFTYMLLAERAPHARILAHDEALAELTLRYFTGHGPANLQDYVWWSGLTTTDAKAGIEMLASQLDSEIINDTQYWFSAAHPPLAEESQIAFLLPSYDEFFLGFSWFDLSRTTGQEVGTQATFDSQIVFGGRIIGGWRRTLDKKTVVIEVKSLAALSSAQEEAINIAAQQYAKFLGLPLLLKIQKL